MDTYSYTFKRVKVKSVKIKSLPKSDQKNHFQADLKMTLLKGSVDLLSHFTKVNCDSLT